MIEKGFRHEGKGERTCFPSLEHLDEPVNKRAAELEWEAWMRVLDHASSQTGHIYQRLFLLRQSTSIQPPVNTNKAAIPLSSAITGSWIHDAVCSPSNGVPDKINVPLQHSPVSSDSREYKDKQRIFKESGELGRTTAGPRSQTLAKEVKN
ncbi:hypothetical protein GCK32_016186 [Trichostrongylus colubriformis]|uniref:Uncharacterized protein n=1 Tax=Trichostrongylus colubriformis TaxID=6319 RepID=A0AAN8J3R2_TRICO